MPSIKAREFHKAFERALSRSGRLAQADVDALERAAAALRDAREKSAANDVLALVKHDRILDENEVDPARRALCRLLGVPAKRLPAALEKALAHAVPVPNVRVKSYDLSFDFSKDGPSFPARARIALEAPSQQRCILEVDPDRLTIDEVRAAGKPVPFEARDGRLFVEADGVKELDVRYHVKPTDDVDGYGLIRDRYAGRMWTLTWPYNTGALFPSTSHPDDGATARVTVHVKAGERAVAAGAARADGSFHLDKPVPAYAIAFTAGKLADMQSAVVDGYEARTVGLGARIPAATRKEMRETTAAAMAWFSRKFGAYRFGKTMNIIEIKSEYGGMEHAGAIAIAVGQSKHDTLEACVHETAHMWFGDSVRIAHWGELWMSEGFTNYATWRFFQHKDGDEAFYRYLDGAKDELRAQLDEGITQPLDEPSSTDPQEGLSWVPYMQGAWMLRMLECRIGTREMDALLRAWFQREHGDAVTTDDFIAYARSERKLELAPFFAAWKKLEAIPTFEDASLVSGSHAELLLKANGTNADLLTSAAASSGPLSLPVRLEGAHGETKDVVVQPGKKLSVDAGFPVKSITWDPARTLLCDVV